MLQHNRTCTQRKILQCITGLKGSFCSFKVLIFYTKISQFSEVLNRSTRFLCIGTFSMMFKFSILPSKFFMSPSNDFIDFSVKSLLYTKFQMFTFQFPSSIEDLITRQIIIIQSKVINCIIKKIFIMW